MFAHTDVHHVRIAFCDSHSTNGASLKESIRDVTPTEAHVVGFPKPSAGRSHVISLRVANDAGGANRSATAKWANRSPLERFENGVAIIRGRRWFDLCRHTREGEAKKNGSD